MPQALTRPAVSAYGYADLTTVERELLAEVNKIKEENNGLGYGEVRVIIQAGRVEYIEGTARKKVRDGD